MSTDTKPRRTERLPVVFYPSEIEAYERAAERKGVRLSDWVRDALSGKAEHDAARTEGVRAVRE